MPNNIKRRKKETYLKTIYERHPELSLEVERREGKHYQLLPRGKTVPVFGIDGGRQERV